MIISSKITFKIKNGNGRNVLGKTSGNSDGNDGTPGQRNQTNFDWSAEAHRNGPMGSMWATSKGTVNGSSGEGYNFYPSSEMGDTDSNAIKNQRFSLSRTIDFASIDTTGDTGSSAVGPKSWAGNMTSAGWVSSPYRREAMWNQTNGFWNFRMMDKTLGVSGGSGGGQTISNVWGSFSSSATHKKRIQNKKKLQETIPNSKMWFTHKSESKF